MRKMLLLPALVAALVTLSNGQEEPAGGADESATVGIAAQNEGAAGAELEFKYMTRPIEPMTDAEIKSYAKNPKFKPKLDSTPTGKAEKQPKTAGVSYLNTASQIIGGTQATQGMFPWQVYLIANNAWLCGGSIITTTAVLTAAHCVYTGNTNPVSFSVTAGGINRNSAESGEVTKTTTTSTYHSSYNPSTLVNDIAVIKFSSPWTFSTTINAIRLPKTSQATTTFAGSSVVASGYGKTSNTSPASTYMNYVTLSVITNSACASVYGSRTVISSTICTAAGSKSTCSGDSGGPLQLKEADGKFTQIGVVSFGAAASCTNYPSGFARVTSFLGWISQQTGVIILK